MRKIIQALLIVSCFIGSLLLSGCFTPKYVEKKQYLFNVSKFALNKKAITRQHVLLNQITATSPYDQINFIYRLSDNKYTVDYYNGFVTPPATQLRQILQNYFAARNNFYPVIADDLSSKYRIDTDLAECYGDYRNPAQPEAVLAIHMIVIKQQNLNQILFDKVFRSRVALQAKTSEQLVAAWDKDLQILLSQISHALAGVIK